MNKRLLTILLAVSALTIYLSQSSFSSGYASGATNGCSCHGAANTATLVSITGFPANYVNGQAYPITISVSNATMVEAGFTLAVSNGTLSAASTGSAITGLEIKHNTPKVITGGIATWTFTWTAPATGSAVNTVRAAGNAVNNNNATSGDMWNFAPTLTVAGPALPITLSATGNAIACNGGLSIITSTAGGGTPPYQYQLNNGAFQSSNAFINNPAGTYTVTVRDATLIATATSVVIITQPTVIALTINTSTNTTCAGISDGTASVMPATGGTGAKTYNWTPGNPPGDGTVAITGLSANTYTCTATDMNGCTKSTSVVITSPTAVTGSASTNSVTCFGGSNGSATVTATGGSGTFTYAWSPSGGTAATATGLIAGSYTCTVTDGSICSTNVFVNIAEPAAAVTATATANIVSCFGGNNGSASVTAAGGTGMYSYNWSPSGGTSATAVSLSAGSYTCTVMDANMCSTDVNVSITEPAAAVTATATANNVSCFGGNNGSASVTAAGGTGMYSYAWSPSGGTAAAATGLSAGSYTCMVMDANMCSTDVNISIAEPAAVGIIANANATNLCSGNTLIVNGSNTAAAIGYTYTWTGGLMDSIPTQALTSATYTVTGTNAQGCTSTSSVSITVNALSSLAQASIGNTNSVAGSICQAMTQLNDNSNNYTNASCNLIATLQDATGANSLGDVTTCVEVLANVPVYNGQPYIARTYTITPQNQGPAIVTLYYTTQDILNYNNYIATSGSGFPLMNLPNNSPLNGDVISNTSITKVNGGVLGTSGNTSESILVNLIYDASNSWWTATFPVSSFSSFYLHTTNAGNAPLNILIKKFAGTALANLHSKKGLDFNSIGTIKSSEVGEYNFSFNKYIEGDNYYKLKINCTGSSKTVYSNTLLLKGIVDANAVSIYPNPVKGLLNYTYANIGSVTKYQIADVTGKIVLRGPINDISKFTINVNEIADGVYTLMLLHNNGSVSKKQFVIK
jgi:hypothetical protein